MMKKLHKACLLYPSWKSVHDAEWKPWSRAHQLTEAKRVDLKKCRPREEQQDDALDESQIGEMDIPGDEEEENGAL